MSHDTASALKISPEATLGAPSNQRRHLLHPTLDFWMLGGLNLVVWFFIFALSHLAPDSIYKRVLPPFILIGDISAILILYSHFFLTYRVAYSRGRSFTLKHWPQLIALPTLLIVLGPIMFLNFRTPITSPFLREYFAYLPELTWAQLYASVAATLISVLVGWHHSKQVFGTMMVYRTLDGYPLSLSQRRLILNLVYALWFTNVMVVFTLGPAFMIFAGIRSFNFSVPPTATITCCALYWLLFAFVFYKVAYRNWRDHGRWPSRQFLIPLVAISLSWIPPFYHAEFYFRYTVAFHGLQYWCVAARYDHGRKPKLNKWAWARWAGTAILAGLVFLLLVPLASDMYLKPSIMGNFVFFIIFVHFSVNLHHYFVDNIVWRMDQPEVRRYLFEDHRAADFLVTPKQTC